MVKIFKDQLYELIDYLQGTCIDLDKGCEDLGFNEDDLTLEQLQEIEYWIFKCPGCGWWCDRSEGHDIDGNDYCEDCYEEYYSKEDD